MLDLSQLTPQQRAVVLAADGPSIVLAGPGSGKTLVVAARIAYLVAGRNVPPASILAVTFTTAAARELRSRLVRLLGDAGGSVDVSTFHALGLRIVRTWCETLELGRGPVAVYGAEDARVVLREALREAGVRLDPTELSALAARLERYRLRHPYGDGTDGAERDESAALVASPEQVDVGRLAGSQAKQVGLGALARAYDARLTRRGAVDYAAMLALPLRLFDRRPDALRLHQDTYRYVLADEGQDVCPTQQALLLLLAARHHNLSIVGDACQAVFAWRGADAGFLARFAQDVPDAQVLGLDECFRCSGRVVAVANALSAPMGRDRPIRTANEAGPTPRLYAAADPKSEAAFVAGEIDRRRRTGEIADLGDVAILYRTNGQAPEFQLALRSRGLPYRTRGPDLFTRREVRDVLAYLRLAVNPNDTAALARVVNTPPRGLGRLAERLRHTPVPLSACGAAALAVNGSAASARVEALWRLVHELHTRCAGEAAGLSLAPAAALDAVLERTGYLDWLRAQASAGERLAALDTLRTFAQRATGGLPEWLAELVLAESEAGAGLDEDPGPPDGPGAGRALLTTIHGAKGGEWDTVFIGGCEEGLLPHAKALAQACEPGGGHDALLEERRLAYVAVTRARRFLYLTYCCARPRGDRLEPRRPSRFLDGLPVQRLRPVAEALPAVADDLEPAA